jgi:hypothetical protein
MLPVALVFIGEYSFEPVRLMFGDDQTRANSVMRDQKIFAATFASDCAHRDILGPCLRLELPS